MSEPLDNISHDPILEGVIEDADRAVPSINADSPIVSISRAPGADAPPYVYRGTLAGVEHFTRRSDDTFRKASSPLPFEIVFEHDYCRGLDPLLQFRVIRTSPLLVHPNVAGGVCCLGPKFRPATRLRSLVALFYRIASGQIAATDDPFDHAAAEFFLTHRSEILALRAPPLWRRSIARAIRVVPHAPGPEAPGQDTQS